MDKREWYRRVCAMGVIGILLGLTPPPDDLLTQWTTSNTRQREAARAEVAPGARITLRHGAALGAVACDVGVVEALQAWLEAVLGPRQGDPMLRFYGEHADPRSHLYPDVDLQTLLGTTLLDDPEQRRAASAAISELLAPVAAQAHVPRQTDNTADGRAAWARQRQITALLSVPAYAFYHALVVRTPMEGGAATSLWRILETEGLWRFTNAAADGPWRTRLSHTGTEGLLREWVLIRAFRLFSEYQQFRQTEQLEAVLATHLLVQGRLYRALAGIQHQIQEGKARGATFAAGAALSLGG